MRRAALAAMLFAWAMLSVSALDSIGLGTMPPRPSWGTMLGGLHEAALLRGPVLLAGACLLLTAIAAIMLAYALTDHAIASRGRGASKDGAGGVTTRPGS